VTKGITKKLKEFVKIKETYKEFEFKEIKISKKLDNDEKWRPLAHPPSFP
jgi:hypothetical protein